MIKKRFVEGVQSSPVKSVTSVKPKGESKGEAKKHIVEVIDDVVASWNLNPESGSGELLDDHPKHLAYSDAQLKEMDPYSKLFWVEPEKRKRMKKEVVASNIEKVATCKVEKEPVKKKKSKPENIEANVSRIEQDPNMKEFMKAVEEEILSDADHSKNDDAMDVMLHQLTDVERKKKKKKKKNKHLERTM